MARLYVGRVARTVVAVVVAVAVATAASAVENTTRVGNHLGDRDDDASTTRRRQIQPLIYHVDEHLPVGSLVGDLRTDMRSACDDRRQADCGHLPTRFSLLHQRPAVSELFNVHETTGVLRSSGVVDREEICFRRETVCSVVLEVAVYYAADAAGAFDVAVVEVSNTSFYCPVSVQNETVKSD